METRYIVLGVIVMIYLFIVFRGLWIERKYKNWFKTDNGMFRELDTVIDNGSDIKDPGLLKNQYKDGWFIVYSDGFAWPVSDKENITHFKS